MAFYQSAFLVAVAAILYVAIYSSAWLIPILTTLLLMVLSAVMSYQVANMQKKRILAAANERWRLERESDKVYDTRESFSTEWLNSVVKRLWTNFLEQYVSRIAKEQIQKKLDSMGARGKLPSAMERIEIEEFTLGTTPPTIHFARMHSTPARDYLQAEFSTTWTASSFRILLCIHLKPSSLLSAIKARFEVRDISVRGSVLLGPRFINRFPGIIGIDFSFAEQPQVDMNLRPLGLAVSEVPGVASWLNEMITKGISKLMVDPKRLFIPLERVLLRQAARKAGGPGGLLTLTIIQAKDLGGPGQSENATWNPFCEVRFLGRVFRTHPLQRNLSPRWNRSMPMQLPVGHFLTRSELKKEAKTCCSNGSHGSRDCGVCQLRIRVVDYGSSGERTVLGSCEVDLESDWVKIGSASDDRWIPLRSSKEKGAAIQLRVTVMPPVPPKVTPITLPTAIDTPNTATPQTNPQSSEPHHKPSLRQTPTLNLNPKLNPGPTSEGVKSFGLDPDSGDGASSDLGAVWSSTPSGQAGSSFSPGGPSETVGKKAAGVVAARLSKSEIIEQLERGLESTEFSSAAGGSRAELGMTAGRSDSAPLPLAGAELLEKVTAQHAELSEKQLLGDSKAEHDGELAEKPTSEKVTGQHAELAEKHSATGQHAELAKKPSLVVQHAEVAERHSLERVGTGRRAELAGLREFLSVASGSVSWIEAKKTLEEGYERAVLVAEEELGKRIFLETLYSETCNQLEASRKEIQDLEAKLEAEKSLRNLREDDHRRDKASWEVSLLLATSSKKAIITNPETRSPKPGDPPEKKQVASPAGGAASQLDSGIDMWPNSPAPSGSPSGTGTSAATQRLNWKAARNFHPASGSSTPGSGILDFVSNGIFGGMNELPADIIEGQLEADGDEGADAFIMSRKVEDLKFQVLQLQSQMAEATRARIQVEQRVTQHKTTCQILESELESLNSKLAEAERAALVQGALFVKHGRESSDLRRLSINATCDALVWAPADTRGLILPKVNIKNAKLQHVERVEAGTDHFPGGSEFKIPKSTSIVETVRSRTLTRVLENLDVGSCFSIVFFKSSGIPNLNLEVPSGGNGRSRDEWVEALRRLVASVNVGKVKGSSFKRDDVPWRHSIKDIFK